MYMLLLYYAYNRLILSRQQMPLYVGIDCMEPQDCFSIPYVIMLDNDIIVLLLVIIPSLLTYYLSQGSVSVILILVYPCCGIWQNEGQNVFAISYLLYLCVIGLP